MQNCALAALAPPVVGPYSTLIENQCKMVIWLPWLLLWSFLIQFLLKIDAKLSSGCLGSSRGRFLFNSYLELMQYGPLAALSLPVVVSYSILIKN